MNGQPVGRLIGVVVGAALLAGCAASGQPAQDKAGAQTLVLNLATVDTVVDAGGVNVGNMAFVKDLESVSAGLIKVQVATNYSDGATVADAESNLVKAIASGDVDGGWPSTRAFAEAGISALEAVEAPLTITSYAAAKAVVSGPVASDLLAGLKGTGVMGLGLAVGPLRRPFAAQAPLLGVADWKGVTFRSFNSPIQADVIRALGATSVNAGSDWTDQVAAGTLRGVEFDIEQYAQNNAVEAPYVTANVVLWPKVFVLALSQKRYDSITAQQRSWVQQAADAATKASVDATYDESAAATTLCAQGARFIDASAAQLAALHDAVRPVIDKLAADPVNGPLLTEIQQIAAKYPQVEEPVVPLSCRSVAKTQVQGIPDEVSKLPNGTYVEQLTAADLAAAGGDVPNQGTWTLKVTDGTFLLSCRFIDRPATDCGGSGYDGGTVEAGKLRGTGNTVYFVNDADLLHTATGCELPASRVLPGHCYVGAPYWFAWAIDGDSLAFSSPGGDPADAQQYTLGTWTRIN
jgi:TRAP-type C4-dicarboxylate transport system substrate-binding protein